MRKWYCVTNPHAGSGRTISKWEGAREVLKGIMKCSDETGIPSESFYLAAVSIGSGNDWIKSTGAPNDIEGIADLLVDNSFSVQDVIKVEAGKAECYMVNCCGIGFDSHLTQRVNLQKNQGKRNKSIYAASLMQTDEPGTSTFQSVTATFIRKCRIFVTINIQWNEHS